MKKCKNCNKQLKGKYQINFCGHKCSASYNNKLRKKPLKNTCLYCGVPVKNNYCNNICQSKLKEKNYFIDIEKGKNVPEKVLKRYLLKKHKESCVRCGWNEKHPTTNKTPVQIHHIDGDWKNNTIKNVELLCPNCHSLTETYCALNKGGGRPRRGKK